MLIYDIIPPSKIQRRKREVLMSDVNSHLYGSLSQRVFSALLILIMLLELVGSVFLFPIKDVQANFEQERHLSLNTEKPYDMYSVVKVNPDGTHTIKIYGTPLNYYNGRKWVSLNGLSLPEKTDIILKNKEDIDLKAIFSNEDYIKFKLGSYELAEGIDIYIEDDELLIKDAKNNLIKTLSRPFSYDAEENKVFCDFETEQDSNNNLDIFVKVPADWLLSDERIYPVTIDPTDTTSTNNMDSYVRMNYPITNYGIEDYFYLGNANFETNRNNIIMEWTLPSDPGGTITNIKLFLYLYSYPPVGSISSYFELHELLETFVESEVTWNIRSTGNDWTNAGAVSPTSASATVVDTLTISSSPTYQYYEWVLRGTGAENPVNWNWGETHDFSIYDPNFDADKIFYYSFYTKEAASDKPYIEITYTESTNTAPNATSVSDAPDPVDVGSDVTFTGEWTESDAEDNVKMYVCKYSDCQNCNTTSQADCWCFSDTWITEPIVTDTCTYTAQSGDVGDNSYWLGVCDDDNACDSTPLSGGTFTVQPSIQFTSTSSSGAESSTPAQLELSLSAAFSENVTVDYAVTNGTATGSGTDYTLASGTATITAGNTTTAIDAVIVDDSIDESDETIEVTISNPANASLGTNTVHTYTITDNDTAGVTVTESADSTDIAEGGATDTYDVVLTSEPTNDVVITISPDSQTTTNPTSLTFTSANWNTAQTVTVTAIDDDVAEGDHTSTITHSSASDDANYNGISISSVTATITDNDTAGITVEPISGLTTTEAGGADTFTVVLDSQPTHDVTIALSSSDTGEGTVSASSLTFTSVNWSTAQTVTVTGVDDDVDDGDIGYTIVTDTASSADSNYNVINPSDVSLTNSDDDDPASSGGGGLPSGAYNPPSLPVPTPENPEGGFKVLINNGNEITNSRTVALKLFAGSNTKRMAISENADFYGAGQEAYQTTKTWTLTEGEEEKTIYVKFYTQYGQASQIVSDTIIYQPSFAKAMEGEEEKEELEEPEPFEPEQPEEQQPEPEEPEQEIEEPEEEVFPPLEEEPSPLEYLPKAIKEIAQKFSPIKDTFVKLKIKTQQDLERLKNIKLTIPNLKELIGLKKPELKSEITFREPVKPEIKELIPEDTLFFTACEDKIHLNTELTSLDKEEPEQEVKLISGHIIKVILKPSHSVKNVKAQFVLKEREEASYESQNSFSDLFLSPVLAKEFENRFVLAEFELTDPDGDGIYTAEIQAPLVAGEYEIITILDYEDEEIQDKELRVITLVDPEGYVWTSLPQGETRIKDANVFLYWFNPEINKYQLWPADEYQQINPQITRETGEYSFLVPEGTYYLKVEADTYLDSQTEPFEVREGEGIHKNIELEKGFWQGMDWKTISLVIILILVFILLLYNFYRDRKFRKKLLA
ncbi:MAG: Calx-beta domain-containing protein [Minisyncoccales bacterium]